jgi:predicted restriction endonuclease
MQIESECRVTRLTDSNYLIASHIKPWSHSNDNEKLDGNNGLLLSPHIDKLFDNGHISFSNNGDMLISSKINPDVLSLWSIDKDLNVGGFNKQQQKYLEYHRSIILKK